MGLRFCNALALGATALAFGALGPGVGGASASGARPSASVRIGSAATLPVGAHAIGALSSSASITLTIALNPRDPAALQAYAEAVSTPGSAVYHRYLTPSVFAARFGATSAAIAAVTAALRSDGLDPGPPTVNGLSISVTTTAARVSQALATSFDQVALPNGTRGYANTSAPSIQQAIAPYVQAVIGLADVNRPLPAALTPVAHGNDAAVRPSVVTGGPQPCTAASSLAQTDGSYTADQLASAYDFSGLYGAGDFGAGETVGLVEFEGNFPSDITSYESCYGVSSAVTYAKVDGGPSSPSRPNGGVETALDAETVIGLAPKANVIVYQAKGTTSSYDMYNAIISQDQAQVISSSWSLCEPYQDQNTTDWENQSGVPSENTLFMEAAIQGQSVVAAAGDDGSEGCEHQGGPDAAVLAVEDPASEPFVTGVGGTSLTSAGSPPSETVWNGLCGGNVHCAGGGGISSSWPMPAFQSGAPASLHVINAHSSGTPCGAAAGSYCRQVPDVSADADPATGYVVYYNAWQSDGGTSAGAPLWGALLALADASSTCHGRAIGFANPLLYKAAANDYAGDFNDVTTGNNDELSAHGGLYPAAVGYDMASGLGTPIGTPLAQALCTATVNVTNPGDQSGNAGKAITPVQINATTSDAGTLSYTASGLPGGLSINPGTGLITGTPTTTGVASVTVTATDSTGPSGSASFAWTIAASAPTASFTLAPSAPIAGATVSFDGSGSTDPNGASITSYAWSFGDGSSGTGAAPTHVYATAGTYTATLTVTDSLGLSSTATSRQIAVAAATPPPPTGTTISAAPTAPQAGFTISPTGPTAGTTASFAAGGSHDPNAGASITSYTWSFGDGTTGSGFDTTHTYTHAGSYLVTLIVADSLGLRGSASSSITVVAAAALTNVSVKLRRGSNVLSYVASGPGTISVSLANGTARAFAITAAGAGRRTLRLSKSLLKRLRRSRTGRLKVRLVVHFTPSVGTSQAIIGTATLRI